MMSEPVELEQEHYTTVDNYGSGFAPYFIALGLWVGALVMTFLLKPFNNRLVTTGANPVVAAFSGLVPWLIVGAIQALLLAFTIQLPCGISVAHPLAYYLLTILAAWVFCAIVQAVIAALGFPGKFLAVVLLMLQLTTAAGTFPIETEFPIFQALSPWLPMTYVVKALRQAMAGVDLSLVGPSVAALVGLHGRLVWRDLPGGGAQAHGHHDGPPPAGRPLAEPHPRGAAPNATLLALGAAPLPRRLHPRSEGMIPFAPVGATIFIRLQKERPWLC